jgi:uncharacterized protein (TIGR02145 family)
MTSLQTLCQTESIELAGGLSIKSNVSNVPHPGTIRWSGEDFEGWNGSFWVSLTSHKVVGAMTDIQGNTYKTIRIGNQIWMTENLRVTQYNDGMSIAEVRDDATWSALTTGAWCWYDNNEDYDAPYGKIYNAYAVSTDKLCPVGWHIPTDLEWTQLTEELGGGIIAGGKLKQNGLEYWSIPNEGATNETGFGAVAGGYRRAPGEFESQYYFGYWWSNTKNTIDQTYYRTLQNYNANISRSQTGSRLGMSVRCLKN